MAGPDVDIEPIGPSELGRVATLARVIWPECFAGILPADRIGPMVEDIYAPATLEADIAERGHRYWIARVDGTDAGYGSAYREADRLWIKKLYLRAEHRGLGLGKRLIAAAIAAFPGSRTLGLYVNDANTPAIGFYKAQGFAVERHVPVLMGPFAFTDYVMARSLSSSSDTSGGVSTGS
jgi:ribosomal protein S18 acetylase RimI-like enzyme